MINPTESDIERRVVWTNRITKTQRFGTIKRVDTLYAWVLYDDDQEPKPRATIPCILDWVPEEAHCD